MENLVIKRYGVAPEKKIVRIQTNLGMVILKEDHPKFKLEGWMLAEIKAVAEAELSQK